MKNEENDSFDETNPFHYNLNFGNDIIVNDNNDKDLGNNLIDFSINPKEAKSEILEISKEYKNIDDILDRIYEKFNKIKNDYKKSNENNNFEKIEENNKYNEKYNLIELIQDKLNKFQDSLNEIKIKTNDLNKHKLK